MAKKKAETPFSELGQHCRNVRLGMSWTQRNVQERMGATTTQMISNIERGICAPSPRYFKAMFALTDETTEAPRVHIEKLIQSATNDFYRKLTNKINAVVL